MDLNVKRAMYAQKLLSRMVVEDDILNYPPRVIIGADVSYTGNVAVAACSVFERSNGKLEHVGSMYAVGKITFPYVPGLLAYRELPLYVRMLRGLRGSRDVVVMTDGHGIAHPRGLGIASHLGIVLDIPSIGVAKKVLVGRVEGDAVVYKGRIVARQVHPPSGSKPIYVSVGHMVSLETAVKIVGSVLKYRIPEPIRIAHYLSRKIAEGIRNRLEKG